MKTTRIQFKTIEMTMISAVHTHDSRDSTNVPDCQITQSQRRNRQEQ
jgi:hypothetical protein